ncbi:hypothetical protein J437_LFUL002883 [Ladona fulva]|uniref:HAT C-terminal dimerisation domain-containing protein n=1 Tax=Ladona fulva TaxID=123851 RepID=A0A8K0KN71_LADFU|nr:hypothetical protein J437_LFUL002883 [Ladona fulva]
MLGSSALNTRLFKELCNNMNSDHKVLLFYTAVRWISKGNVVGRVFKLKNEIKQFLEMEGKHDFMRYFNDEIQGAAYLSDILDQLNKLNLKLQGKETHIIYFKDNIQAFILKLQNWRLKVNLGNFAMFEHHSTKTEESETGIVDNDVSDIPDEVQDEFLELRNDSSARDIFQEKSSSQFWCAMRHSYPKVSMLSFQILVRFASTYLCESGFSILMQIKTKARNKLDVQDDMRLVLTKTQPRIITLAEQMQA